MNILRILLAILSLFRKYSFTFKFSTEFQRKRKTLGTDLNAKYQVAANERSEHAGKFGLICIAKHLPLVQTHAGEESETIQTTTF